MCKKPTLSLREIMWKVSMQTTFHPSSKENRMKQCLTPCNAVLLDTADTPICRLSSWLSPFSQLQRFTKSQI
jgi:hypothetical protein